MQKKLIILKIILAILFVGCLFDMPYGYYQFIRLAGVVGFGVLAYDQYHKNTFWFSLWLISAVLINPFFKVHLDRFLWNAIDVTWAVCLVFSLFQSRKNIQE